jgi:3-deoxy-D-arabino-heptulosonate 7-phosphate (DAHP) synthase
MARPTNAPAGGVPAADPVVAGGVAIGSGTFTLIARPPGGVDGEGLLEAARLAREAHAGLLDVDRAWASLGADAVDACRRASGLGPVCAVREPGDLAEAAPLAAALRVDAAALDGSLLPRGLATAGVPVLLERGRGTAVEAWLRAAERLRLEGGLEVVLCDPGDDLGALPSLLGAGGRPLVVDASGRAGGALARAAAALGADGVVIEVDGALDGLSSELDAVAAAVGRRMAARRIRYVGQGTLGDPVPRWRRR